jgi:hypothetical protein
VSALLACCFPSSAAAQQTWQFHTPGEAAYCAFGARDYDLLCVRPGDGFWVGIAVSDSLRTAHVDKGYDTRWRGFRNRSASVLRFGRMWLSSDAAVLSCVSRPARLVCRHYAGWAFSLDRDGGHRVYRGPQGAFPEAYPFFRTRHGVWCGDSAGVGGGEPSYATLSCWRVSDGATASVSHGERGRGARIGRNPLAVDHRLAGFPLLREGRTFVWGCRLVSARSASRCSRSGPGPAVFTCRSGSKRLRCVNRFGRGFVFGADAARPI